MQQKPLTKSTGSMLVFGDSRFRMVCKAKAPGIRRNRGRPLPTMILNLALSISKWSSSPIDSPYKSSLNVSDVATTVNRWEMTAMMFSDYSSLLLVVNLCCASRLAIGVRAFARNRQGLAVFRNDLPPQNMELPACLLVLKRASIGVNLRGREGVPRCSSDRVLLAIVLRRGTKIKRSTVLPLPGDGDLHSSVNRLIH